jgi:nitrogen fixation protein NifU and related proteins
MSRPESAADIAALYQEMILDHYRRPRNKGTLPDADASVEMRNPNCGDVIHLQVKFSGESMVDVRFSGGGCAISQASASMMTQIVAGKSPSEVDAIRNRFRDLMLGEATAATDARLGSLRVLAGVSRLPVRVKCALLAWNALDKILASRSG